MRLRRIAFVCILVALVTVSLAGGVYAVEYRVTALDATSSNYGWMTHSPRCWGGKGGIISAFNGGALGNPGPRPGYNLGFETIENGAGGGTDQPSQVFVGTNRYVGTKLSDIRKIDYWAIVDWRGTNSRVLLDDDGNAVNDEWTIESLSSQPPAVVLYFTKEGTPNGNFRTAIYRPWGPTSGTLEGFGPSGVDFNATGTARLHRIWQEYTATEEGVWYVTASVNVDHPTGMYSWSELVAAYPDAALATPTVPAKVPDAWGNLEYEPAFAVSPAQAPIAASFNLHMGAMWNNNTDWVGVNKDVWWNESYWARASADLVTFEYDSVPGDDNSIVSESFDFDTNPARGNYIRALNNLAISDQTIYMPGMFPPDVLPNRRTRKSGHVNPIPWGEGTYIGAKMNAIQKQGGYGTSTLYTGAFPGWTPVAGTTKGNLQVVYGRVCADPPVLTGADSGRWFYVDDGSGVKVKCYCPGGVYVTAIRAGNYLRMLGSLQGNNPNEWYWNQFHMVAWNADPLLGVYSKPWPWEFQTYRWNVTRLD